MMLIIAVYRILSLFGTEPMNPTWRVHGLFGERACASMVEFALNPVVLFLPGADVGR
jgi:hypothetical protein